MRKNIIFVISFIIVAAAIFFIKSPFVLAATLSLSPASGNYVVGNNFNLVVTLNTAGANTDGVDLHYLRFNQSLLKLESVNLGNLYPNTLTNVINNTNGTYDFAQTTAGGTSYTGSGTLLTLTFSVLGAGTAAVSFDYTLGSGLDCNVASGGSDVLTGVTNGSYSLTAAPDTTAPSAVANLAASNPTANSITLTWTAPGDDGGTGTAASYDIRYSTSQITDANWASASQVANEATPLTAGSSQSMGVSGLSSDTTYYFAMKTSDEVPNTSAISNSPSLATTNVSDTAAPQISNVQASGITAVDGLITWTTDEPATSQVEYGTSVSYGSATNLDTNLANAHTAALYNLTASTLYHYRVKSKDAADNEAISNDYTFTTASSGGGDGDGGGGGGGNGGGTSYPDGSLLKSPDNKIYILDNQQKRWIISLEAFESCNYNWDAVKAVSQVVIDQYQDGYNFHGCPHEIILLKSPDNPAVYQISKSTKRHLPSIEVFESYGYPWTDIQIISQSELDAYPRTELIKTDADPKAYYFSTTRTRRWLPSGDIFDAYGFDWAKLVIINETEMAVYPDCRVIKTADSPDVYQLSDTIKRKITSTQAFETLGYQWEDINVVSQLEFDFYQIGEPYSI